MLAGSHQPGPVFGLTSTRRPPTLFVCLLPALHLTGLNRCKMRKNGFGVIVERFRGSESPLFTCWKREKNLKRGEMGLP